MFDSWDHTVQTGNDTEYAFVLLALCVGVAYSFVRFIVRHRLAGPITGNVFRPSANSFLSAARDFTSLAFNAISPPPLELRI